MIIVDSENYFDIAEAIYTFCSLNHGGQSCPLYSILSMSSFRPSPLWSESKVETENYWYCELNENNIQDWNESLEKYIVENK